MWIKQALKSDLNKVLNAKLAHTDMVALVQISKYATEVC